MAKRRWNIETIKQVVEGENPFYQSGYTGKEKQKKKKKGSSTIDRANYKQNKLSCGYCARNYFGKGC